MNKFLNNLKSSTKELKNLPSLTGAAMLTALNVALSYFTVVISTTFQVGFTFLALAAAGMLYGPITGGIVGVLGDIIKYMIKPNGPFFPGFTLSEFIIGFIYGIFLYKHPVTLKRVALAQTTVTILTDLILTPLWLYLMYGTALIAIPRLIRVAIMLPVSIVILYVLAKNLEKIKHKQLV